MIIFKTCAEMLSIAVTITLCTALFVTTINFIVDTAIKSREKFFDDND